jgi:TctA family transporter
MHIQNIVVYILAVLLISNAIVYLIVASQEYEDLIEFQQIGIDGETHEKQLEISVFVGASLIYLGLFIWVLKSKLKNKNPYLVSAVFSIVMIGIYIASRTIGVPVVGVEYYVGKIDIVSKILQAAIIGVAGYLIFAIRNMCINEQGVSQNKNRKSEIE